MCSQQEVQQICFGDQNETAPISCYLYLAFSLTHLNLFLQVSPKAQSWQSALLR